MPRSRKIHNLIDTNSSVFFRFPSVIKPTNRFHPNLDHLRRDLNFIISGTSGSTASLTRRPVRRIMNLLCSVKCIIAPSPSLDAAQPEIGKAVVDRSAPVGAPGPILAGRDDSCELGLRWRLSARLLPSSNFRRCARRHDGIPCHARRQAQQDKKGDPPHPSPGMQPQPRLSSGPALGYFFALLAQSLRPVRIPGLCSESDRRGVRNRASP